MIMSFRDRETERIFFRETSRKLPIEIQRVALRKLVMIHAAINIRDLSIPLANHLESLKGKRRGQYSIRINRQWRVCFQWHDGHATNVEITDYHS
ncbi:MAG: type II toxin-antitoxin system RelE/ParE family toxin [bacterium]|nr:type II toxin-antitoxin system RelE/ParE family toxin [bacterium]